MNLNLKLLIGLVVFVSSFMNAQEKMYVTDKKTGKELELIICYEYKDVPVFHFTENSSSYPHKDSVKYFIDILLDNNIKSLKLYASANPQELVENSNISEERGNTIAQLMQECGYALENIEIDNVKDQHPLSSIENDPKNRRVEIAIIKN